MSNKNRLYISGPFSKEPISMSPIKGGKSDGGYFIYEASGGPLRPDDTTILKKALEKVKKG